MKPQYFTEYRVSNIDTGYFNRHFKREVLIAYCLIGNDVGFKGFNL